MGPGLTVAIDRITEGGAPATAADKANARRATGLA